MCNDEFTGYKDKMSDTVFTMNSEDCECTCLPSKKCLMHKLLENGKMFDEISYKKGDEVLSISKWSNGLKGIIHAVYQTYVSVNFGTKEDPSYQRFHLWPSHHSQSDINEISKT